MAQMQLFLLQFLKIVLTVKPFFVLGQSSSGDTMNSSLIDGQTLISAGSVFQLGFFSPINDSAHAYIGIWYYNLPPRENKVVVWVANRNRSVNTSMASLNLTSDGNLILLEEGTKVWSTGTAAEPNSARLQLLDSGNLVLTDVSSKTLWQSFDHGCDTLLPGMKVGFNFRTNTSWQLVSWMSDTDPSPGRYIDNMEPYNVPDFVIVKVNGSVKTYRVGPWNGRGFVGLPIAKVNSWNLLNFTYVSNKNETYYLPEYKAGLLLRGVQGANGTYESWIFAEGEWKTFASFPRDECDYYDRCGRNSVCTEGYFSFSCRCLEGFENKSGAECARKEPLNCLSNQFWKEPNVKVPDTENATSHGNISLDACKKFCSGDCSCVAYSVISGPYGCITWRGDLLDLRSFTDGGDDLYIRLPAESSTSNSKEPLRCSSNQFSKEPSVKLPDTENATSQVNISLDACKKLCLDDCSCAAFAVTINGTYGCITWRSELLDLRSFTEGGEDLYIRLPESSTSNWKKFMWAIVISALLGILLLCCVGVLIRRRRNGASTCRLQFPNVQKGSISSLDVLPSYDLHAIKAATNDFSEENKLGEGGFGVVYKGQLEDGQKIAVKKLSRYSSQGPNEFQNELSVIAKLQHRNLVRLLGSCIEGDERLIILEFMENKSLDAFIYDKTKSLLLNWQRCFDIIIGIARGLLYLHQDSRLRVVHRDLKPSNILLDKDMNPKISDFGIARIFEGDNALEDATTRPVGTFGYMAPEYLSYGLFSFKSDVFSFGVIVLEIISGKKNRVFSHTDTSVNLLGHIYKLWKEGRSLEILDDTLNQSYSAEEVMRCIQTSLLCVQDKSEDRPTMAEVVMMLASEDQLLTPLKQPTITTTSNEGDFTTKEMSFTLVSE